MLDLKRGDTLSYSGFLPEGWLPSGTWSVLCKVQEKKTGNKFPVTATLTPPSGAETRYALSLYASAADVAAWPIGKLNADIQFTNSATTPPYVFSSATFIVNLMEDVA
ncbi:hypothetical protein H4CHR_02992 [Variovorax sp. PBS-H4]|uniref:hypothetical protein n=1 Tax=Variovorax sp. PBS-H4 TaxID=434008 RepID=UPI001315C879|nr:hypothetical protein [Variovorax sp. PBS-H4]VTU32342.1 hypothetical protein H4CHR_02992 [Variovorax sp. PBS-H4]